MKIQKEKVDWILFSRSFYENLPLLAGGVILLKILRDIIIKV